MLKKTLIAKHVEESLMNPRIRSSVGIVKVNDHAVEFFKGNTRRSIILKVNAEITKIICTLDGNRTMEEIEKDYHMDSKTSVQFEKLIFFLKANGIVMDAASRIINDDRIVYSRVFSMLEDYSSSEDDVQKAWKAIIRSTVLIVGLGAVGSWIAATLVQSGVKNLILMDCDQVELSNLHRQWGYRECDIGKEKTAVLKERLQSLDSTVNVTCIHSFLTKDNLDELITVPIDLVIDCADKPTVDQTAEWIGAYCMEHSIAHIIAGGYNLHLSLIGQTIIPFQTACVKCFETQLKEQNEIELTKMKKLAQPNRKIGSIGPLCTISASIAALEAIKVLSGLIPPGNCSRRGEFNIHSMDIKFHSYPKLENCEWCGAHGKYKRIKPFDNQ